MARRRVLVAALLSGRVGAEVDGLRRALGSVELGRIPPHVTLVPPTNLDDLGAASAVCATAAAEHASLELTLGPPASFPDNPRVLFLAVGPVAPLQSLRRSLLRGPFSDREDPGRGFVPHVTLLSGRDRKDPAPGRGLLASYRTRVVLSEVTLLVHDDGARRWRAEASFTPGGAATRGRGGLALTLRAGEIAPPGVSAKEAEWLEARSRYVSAELDSATVGLARWHLDGSLGVLDSLVVDPGSRRLGIGARLLAETEGEAHRLGAGSLVAAVRPGGAAAEFLASRGYRDVTGTAVGPEPAPRWLGRRLGP